PRVVLSCSTSLVLWVSALIVLGYAPPPPLTSLGRDLGHRAHLPTLRLLAHGFPGCSHRHYRRRSNPAGPNRDPESYMNTPAVEIENLSVTFPGPNKTRIEAVKNVSLTLTPGKALGIVGESG